MKKETAEQKLLKMIEVSADPSQETKVKQKISKKQNILGFIKTINKLLILVVVGLVGLVGWEIKSETELFANDIQFNMPADNIKRVKTDNKAAQESPKKLNDYLASISQRNIFQPYDEAQAKGAVEVAGESRRIAREVAGLKLVGISWLDSVDSASALIEDTQKKETYFLMRDEKIGDLTVSTIYADSVKLSHENEEIIITYDKSQM